MKFPPGDWPYPMVKEREPALSSDVHVGIAYPPPMIPGKSKPADKLKLCAKMP